MNAKKKAKPIELTEEKSEAQATLIKPLMGILRAVDPAIDIAYLRAIANRLEQQASVAEAVLPVLGKMSTYKIEKYRHEARALLLVAELVENHREVTAKLSGLRVQDEMREQIIASFLGE